MADPREEGGHCDMPHAAPPPLGPKKEGEEGERKGSKEITIRSLAALNRKK